MPNIIFSVFSKRPRRVGKAVELLLLTALFCSLASCQKKNSPQMQTSKKDAGQTSIADGFFAVFSNEPVRINAGLQKIRRLDKAPAIARAAFEKDGGVLRRYANEALNSRIPDELKSSAGWKIKWQTELPAAFAPSAILETHERIVLETDGFWVLFDRNGKRMTHDALGASGIFLDGENFYAADPTGLIRARRLSDGSHVFELSLHFGDDFERRFMTRRGRSFLAVSTERETERERAGFKENSLIEAVDLGETLKTDGDGRLQSAKEILSLARKTGVLLAAAREKTIVFAAPNRIYAADRDMNFTRALEGDFTPLFLSLDEEARIYLTVEKEKRRFLWVLLPTGEQTVEFELPASFGRLLAPPIVGYDHRVYLVSEREIIAVDQRGEVVWKTGVEEIKGAVITANQMLLVAAGKELFAIDANGKRQTLYGFTDQTLQTPPVLTASGEILIATQKSLVNLSDAETRP